MATGQQIQVPFAEVTTEFHKIYQQLVEEGK
jgi:histidyl-tRNA synthetase